MELFILFLTIGSFSDVVESTRRTCASISRIEKINSNNYNLKCQNSDDLLNIHLSRSEFIIKCNQEVKYSKTNEEVNKNHFMSNRWIKNAKDVVLEECSWNQLQVLFDSNDGLFKSFKNNLTYVKLQGVIEEYDEVELPAVLPDFFPNLDYLDLWHIDKVVTTFFSENQIWPPKLYKLDISDFNSSSIPIFSNSNITDLYLNKGRNIGDFSNLRYLEKLVSFTIDRNDALEVLNGEIFTNHSALRTLHILLDKNTKLSEITSTAFNGLTSLEDFVLHGSKVQNISSDLFEKCSSLRGIKLLYNNHLCYLSDYILPKNIRNFTLKFATSSQILPCKFGGGVTISSNAFTNAIHLENLELVHTKLNYKELVEDLNLKNFKNLKRLDLKYNKISQIKAAIDLPQDLEFLDLRYQEPHLEYSEALKNLNVKCIVVEDDSKLCGIFNSGHCDCKNSSTIKEKLCLNRNTSECQTTAILKPLLISIASVIIFAIFIGYRMRYHLYDQPFCYKLYFCFKTESNVDNSHEEYDVFIMHCDTSYCECHGFEDIINNDGRRRRNDNDIVLELRNKLTDGSLGRKFKVASKDDFICGKPESLNLQKLVQCSRRIIVLLSNSFLHSPYHAGEYRQIAAINRERYYLLLSSVFTVFIY